MDKKIKNLRNDIMNGINLEESIPPFLNHLTSMYHTYAGVRLAMHYYAFYEAYCDDEKFYSENVKIMIAEINQFIQNKLLHSKGNSMEEIILTVDSLRNNIMKRMQILANYTDIFQNYEYILNRTEYQFNDEIFAVDDEEFAREVLRYIFDSEDNLIINEKMKEMVGQLPIRITKQKYFDIINQSLTTYLGSNQASLNSYLYMIRTSAMLYYTEGMEENYPELWKNKTYLSELKYKDITKSEFDKASMVLNNVIEKLEIETSVYYSLQEIVNEVYAILLCSPYAGVAVSDMEEQQKVAFDIIEDINQLFIKMKKQIPPVEIINRFTEIEGVQEDLTYDLTSFEEVIFKIDSNHRNLIESFMVDKHFNSLRRSSDLLSNSLFIEFDKDNSDPIVDEAMLTMEKERLMTDLTELFASHDRVIGRAVMANTLNKIPVFFRDHKEVMDYVRYALERCTDLKEKMACVNIITQIMSE